MGWMRFQVLASAFKGAPTAKQQTQARHWRVNELYLAWTCGFLPRGHERPPQAHGGMDGMNLCGYFGSRPFFLVSFSMMRL